MFVTSNSTCQVGTENPSLACTSTHDNNTSQIGMKKQGLFQCILPRMGLPRSERGIDHELVLALFTVTMLQWTHPRMAHPRSEWRSLFSRKFFTTTTNYQAKLGIRGPQKFVDQQTMICSGRQQAVSTSRMQLPLIHLAKSETKCQSQEHVALLPLTHLYSKSFLLDEPIVVHCPLSIFLRHLDIEAQHQLWNELVHFHERYVLA